MQVKYTAAIVGALVALSGTAHGRGEGVINSSWAAGVSGFWSNAAAWNPFGVPNNFPPQFLFYNASIQFEEASPFSVLLDLDVEIENFTLDSSEATMNLGFSTMQVNSDFSLLSGLVTRTPGKEPPPETAVHGVLRLSDGTLMNAGNIVSYGSIIFGTVVGREGATNRIDICNTGVDHRGGGAIRLDAGTDVSLNQGGSLGNDSDGTISIGETGPVRIDGDGTGTLTNEGTLLNTGVTSRSPGGLPLTDVSGIKFYNNGTVTVIASELRLETTNPLAGKGALVDGVWNIDGAGNLNFVETSIYALQAEVNIFGSDSQFNAINTLQDIISGGKFQIANGKDFVVSEFLYNGGEIKVGSNSTFDSGYGLDNLKGNALFGGKFVIAGTFLSGAEGGIVGIEFLGSDLTLDGPDSVFTGIEALNQIGSGGRFALENGRSFGTLGNLNVSDGGMVRVGAGSTLTVNGDLNNNDPGGLFSDGVFDIEGAFIANNLNIVEISNEIILDGPTSVLLNGLGQDALSALNRITETGILRLRNGRSIENIDDLIVDGILDIDGSGGTLRSALAGLVQVNNGVEFSSASGLEFVINGTSADEHGKLIAATVDVHPGATIRFSAGPGASLVVGEELQFVSTPSMTGVFAVVESVDLGNGFGLEVSQGPTGVTGLIVSNSCPADIEPDGVLNFFDVAAFIDAFLNQLPVGDFNNDGQFDFFDVSAFVVSFGRGCP